MKTINFIFLISTTLFISKPLLAETFYVSEEGNNRNNGESWENSWRTLDYASKFLYPGDTLIIRKSKQPYTYIPVIRSGTETAPITIKGEDALDPPIITGAVQQVDWKRLSNGSWSAQTSSEPNIVIEDKNILKKGSSTTLANGTWYWKSNTFYYKPVNGTAFDHSIWRTSMGGGIQIGNNSWIKVENINCWYGKGACVSIKGGKYNVIDNVSGYWHTRGFEINGGKYNIIKNCRAEYNKDGIYLLNGASYNEINNCKVFNNGRTPFWTKGDRAGIAIGESGVNPFNIISNNEIAYNGGPMSDPALIVYKAPNSTIEKNNIHDNYGSGAFITISSDNSVAKDNFVTKNGVEAKAAGRKNISGLSVRRSKNVTVENNIIKENTVSKDSEFINVDKGPRAGLDLRGNSGDNLSNIKFINNIVCGTKNGPNVYIQKLPNMSGFYISPSEESANQATVCD